MNANQVEFIDVTVRDGQQSLWGATAVTTGMIESIAPILDKAGFKAVDLTTGTHMAVSVIFHRENPWHKMRVLCQAMPNTPLSFGTSGQRFMTFKLTPDSVIELMIEKVADTGIRRFWLTDPSNNMAVLGKTARLAKKAGIEEVVISLVYTVSPVHTDEYYAQKAREAAMSPDVDGIYVKDPTGLLAPERARTLIPAIAGSIHGLPLEIHSHCTLGLAPICYVEAAKLGVKVFHTAVPPLANGTSLPSIKNVVKNLRWLGYSVNLDEEALAKIESYFTNIAERENRPTGIPQEYDVSVFDHHVPGGMATTLKRQLSELKMEHRFQEVLEEIIRIRMELGYPIMVTPFSQFVGTQATMNVISGERYKTAPTEIIQYAAGWFGDPPAPIDQNVLDKISSLPAAKGIFGKVMPQPSIKELRQQIGVGPKVSDEEFLLRYALPASKVDEMLTACNKD